MKNLRKNVKQDRLQKQIGFGKVKTSLNYTKARLKRCV